ncbi:MAG TPA: pitrilysin family protein, partial [Gemmatimonadales bacterium]|nr:pitrilysin family protein [Gemmatimonadales bacterium]
LSAAARFLLPDAVGVVAYLPEGVGDDLEADDVAAAFRAPARRPLRSTRAPADILHVELPGADLLIRRKSGVPLVSVGVYRSRLDPDPPELAGLSALTARAAVRGAGDHDAAGLAFAFERLGGVLSPSVNSDWEGFGTTVLADQLRSAAALLDLVYRRPRLADDAILAERTLMVNEARQMIDDMFRFPFRLAFTAAFGRQGYGLPVGGLPETLGNITPEHVREAAAARGGRVTVVAVGEIDPEAAAEQLAEIFGDYQVQARQASSLVETWQLDHRPIIDSVDRDKSQSALAMVFPGPGRNDPDRAAAQVWAAVASGLGGRLFEELRDRRSLAYTVLAAAWQRRRAGALVTYIATSPEREPEARDAMLDELDRFRNERVTDIELDQAINYLAGQAEVRRQSGAALAGEILDAWLVGSGLDELRDPTALYRSVTADAVLEVARRCLDRQRRAEGLVRGSGSNGER